jgi:hypothetical protein
VAARAAENGIMTARQGKIAVAATVVILSGLLLRQAIVDGVWSGFWATEVQVLVAMSISWWVLTRH